ncbi:hypothetical protein [Microbacterium aurugineum]
MPPRSLTIDEGLLQRMARDAAIYSLTRPAAIVMWVALAGALTLSILNLSTPCPRAQNRRSARAGCRC